MKKHFILLAGLAAGAFGAHAQSDHDGPVTATYFESDKLKPSAGNFSTEFGLIGGILNSELELTDGAKGQLKFRYFLKDDLALRLGANIGFATDKVNIYGNDEDEVGTFTEKQSTVLINLGIEKHFAGTRRLSPYVGGDILIGTTQMRAESEDSDGDFYDEGLNIEVKGPGTFSFGVRGVVGADFYIAKHVFIGAEAGLGFQINKAGKTEINIQDGNQTETITLESAGSTFDFGPSVITGIRIGFIF